MIVVEDSQRMAARGFVCMYLYTAPTDSKVEVQYKRRQIPAPDSACTQVEVRLFVHAHVRPRYLDRTPSRPCVLIVITRGVLITPSPRLADAAILLIYTVTILY